jgi:hypothetical protein
VMLLYINGEALQYIPLCKICELCSGEVSYFVLLDCDIVSGKRVPAFQRHILPPYSG